METLLQLDEQLFHLINHNWHHAALDAVMPYWRDKRVWIPLYLVIAGYCWYRFRVKGIYLVLALGLTVGIADNVSSQLIKKTVKRIRPCNDATLTQEVQLLVPCGSGYSFTSSHAVNHFAVATFLSMTLGLYHRRIRLPLFLWAASIAFGQVYVGVHYPLDVICGALLGSLLAYALARLYWRLKTVCIPLPPRV